MNFTLKLIADEKKTFISSVTNVKVQPLLFSWLAYTVPFVICHRASKLILKFGAFESISIVLCFFANVKKICRENRHHISAQMTLWFILQLQLNWMVTIYSLSRMQAAIAAAADAVGASACYPPGYQHN